MSCPQDSLLFLSRQQRGGSRAVVVLLCLISMVGSASPPASIAGDTTPVEDEAFYQREIKPLLRRKCYACHGSLRQESNLRVDTVEWMRRGGDGGPAISPGQLDGLLLQRVAADESERMPPAGEPLTAAEIDALRRWVQRGAAAPRDEAPQPSPETHWAFQPIARPKPRAPEEFGMPASPIRHPVDAFVRWRLHQQGLEPSPPAAPLSLVRRLFLVLHGLPPTAEQARFWTERLVADRERAVPALIDELLASPRYGERWGQHWLDVVRYADTHGFEVNTPRPHAWPYRDYVIRAFNEDRPYGQFITEQLVGDQLGEDAATGFLVAAAVLLPGQIGKDDASKRLARQDSLDEIVVGASATLLGMTVGCARCHEHKFDPISQRDYYALQACFAGVEYGDRPRRDDEARERQRRRESIERQHAELRGELELLRPLATSLPTLVIDDEDASRTSHLKKKNGHGANPAGAGRGYRDDQGGADREPNLSGGRYTWWDNVVGEDVFTWNPGANGRFRLWVSWGVHGSGVHTRDARYVLDADGDLATRDDQREVARADQYRFAGQTEGDSEQKPLWSGLQYAGEHEFHGDTRVVLRGGSTNTGITADVIVLQAVAAAEAEELSPGSPAPRLREPVNPRLNVERFAPREAKFIRFTTLATVDDNRHQPCIDELEVFAAGAPNENIALASRGVKATSSGNYAETGKHQLKHINDGQHGNSQSWISDQFGGGWVQLELPSRQLVESIRWGRDREQKFNDRLPVRYRIETSLDGENWSFASSSVDRLPIGTPHDGVALWLRRLPGDSAGGGNAADAAGVELLAMRLASLERQREQLGEDPLVYAGVFRSPDTTWLLRRGDPEQPGDVVSPGTPNSLFSNVLPPVALSPEASDVDRRRSLAAWLTHRDNPLTARVIVNRVWQQLFGQGLVATPSDFGLRCAPPTHPELLDFLASELHRSGGSLKQLQRLILTSATFQQASRVDPRRQEMDADNRLLWRYRSRRLEAEAIRDSMLLASGQLNLETGGPGFNFFQSRGGLSGFPPLEKFTGAELRRMIYSHKIRMEQVPVFGAFDCPDAGQPAPRRSQSTTAIQALNLLNSDFVHEQAVAMASHLLGDSRNAETEAVGQLEAAVEQAFRRSLGRAPSDRELSAAVSAAQEHGLETLCRVLFNTNEFLFVP